MDWSSFVSTFVAIFVAEVRYKTQLATLTFAAGARSRWIVFAASALALVTASAVAVLAGEAVSRLVSPAVLRRAAGVVFIVLGVVYLVGRS